MSDEAQIEIKRDRDKNTAEVKNDKGRMTIEGANRMTDYELRQIFIRLSAK